MRTVSTTTFQNDNIFFRVTSVDLHGSRSVLNISVLGFIVHFVGLINLLLLTNTSFISN